MQAWRHASAWLYTTKYFRPWTWEKGRDDLEHVVGKILSLVDQDRIVAKITGRQLLQGILDDHFIVLQVRLFIWNVLSRDLCAELKEVTNLDAILSKGNMFIGEKTADVVDERNIIANKENIMNVGIVMLQKAGTMNQDERFTTTRGTRDDTVPGIVLPGNAFLVMIEEL